jgi:precorrin-6B methylase 2
MPELDPTHILQLGLGFFASKTLLSAVELGLFTELGKRPMNAGEIREALGLHLRAVPDFPDALVALKFLARHGDGPGAVYSNTPETAVFLDRNSPDYIGGILEMANARLYRFWADLTEALKTGAPQNEMKHSGEPMFAKLYEAPERLGQFMEAMAGISAANFRIFAEKFDFSKYRTLSDVGGATGQLSCLVASANPHMRCISFDLPKVTEIAKRKIDERGLAERVSALAGDFFADAWPKADVITMGMILHDWNLEKKRILIRKAYEALPQGGALVAIEAVIDDARRENAFGLLMSLNMLVEFGDAFDFTGADFVEWCREAGFSRFDIVPLAGPSSAAIAYK